MGIFSYNQDTSTLVRMMKISYYPVIFCLFTLISHKKIPWMTGGGGGGQPIPAGLSSDWLWILLLLLKTWKFVISKLCNLILSNKQSSLTKLSSLGQFSIRLLGGPNGGIRDTLI